MPMNEHMEAQRGDAASGVAWLALIIAIVSLSLAWVAYNRSGADLEEQIKREVNQAITKAEEARQAAENAGRAAGGAVINESGKALNQAGTELQQQSKDVKSDSEDRR